MPLKGRALALGKVIRVWGSYAIGLRISEFTEKGIGCEKGFRHNSLILT